MEKQECKEKLEVLIPYLKAEMGLSDWYIDYKVNESDKADHKGQVKTLYDQQEVFIEFEHNEISDDEDLCRVARHEMIHLLSASYDLLWDQIGSIVGRKKRDKFYSTAFYHAGERHVRAVEMLCERTENLNLNHLKDLL